MSGNNGVPAVSPPIENTTLPTYDPDGGDL